MSQPIVIVLQRKLADDVLDQALSFGLQPSDVVAAAVTMALEDEQALHDRLRTLRNAYSARGTAAGDAVTLPPPTMDHAEDPEG